MSPFKRKEKTRRGDDTRGRTEAPHSATAGVSSTAASKFPQKPTEFFPQPGVKGARSAPVSQEDTTASESDNKSPASVGRAPRWFNPVETHALYDPERRERPPTPELVEEESDIVERVEEMEPSTGAVVEPMAELKVAGPQEQQRGDFQAKKQRDDDERVWPSLYKDPLDNSTHMLEALQKTRGESEHLVAQIEQIIRDRETTQKSISTQVASETEVPTMYYPGIEQEVTLWSKAWKKAAVKHTKNFDNVARRENILFLKLKGKKFAPPIPQLAGEDREECGDFRQEERTEQMMSYVRNHPEFTMFEHGLGRGLIIHCNERTEDSVEGPTSIMSVFLNDYSWKAFKDGAIVLTHAAGVCKCNPHREHLRGESGLLRSLCAQLIFRVEKTFSNPLRFDYLDEELYNSIAYNDFPAFCILFREVLCELASLIADEGNDPMVVLVLVDGIHHIESSSVQELVNVVDFLRAVCDEVAFGELGSYINFRYLLIDPGTCDMLLPYPIERHIIFSPVDTPAGGDSEASTQEAPGPSTGKGKARVSKDERRRIKAGPRDGAEAIIPDPPEQIKHMLQAFKVANPDVSHESTLDVVGAYSRTSKDRIRTKMSTIQQWRDGLVPSIEYPIFVVSKYPERRTRPVHMWFAKSAVPSKDDYHSKLADFNARSREFNKAVRVGDKCNFDPHDMADQHIKQCFNILKQGSNEERCRELIKLSEVVRFDKVRSGGLIVHGNDPTFNRKQPTSLLSAFLAVNIHQFTDKQSLGIAYATGLVSSQDTGHPILRGVRGCLRTLCSQLSRFNATKETTGLPFLTSFERLEAVRHGYLDALLFLFRDLILDIAKYISHGKGPPKLRIVAIIDSIHWLEEDPEFLVMIDFFRTLCDEVEFGDLGNYVEFKYLLLHPVQAKLARIPHLLERHLSLDGDKQAQASKAIDPTPLTPSTESEIAGSSGKGKAPIQSAASKAPVVKIGLPSQKPGDVQKAAGTTSKAPPKGAADKNPNVQTKPPLQKSSDVQGAGTPVKAGQLEEVTPPKEGDNKSDAPQEGDAPQDTTAPQVAIDPGHRQRSKKSKKSATPQKPTPKKKAAGSKPTGQTQTAPKSSGDSQEGDAPDVKASSKQPTVETEPEPENTYNPHEVAGPGNRGKGKALNTGESRGESAAQPGSSPETVAESPEDRAKNMLAAYVAWLVTSLLTRQDLRLKEKLLLAQVKDSIKERSELIEQVKEAEKGGKPPLVDWSIPLPGLPNGCKRLMWSEKNPIPFQGPYDSGLETPKLRTQALREALGLGQEPAIREIVHLDRQYYENVLEDPKEGNIERLNMLKDHPLITRFRSMNSGGLIISDNNPEYEQKNICSDIGGFMTMYARTLQEESPENLAITHSAGRNIRGNRNVAGAEGLMRSLCAQLLGHPVFPKGNKKGKKGATPDLHWLTLPDLDSIKNADRGVLALLFKHLLCEIATRIMQQNRGFSRITAIVDGMDFVEGCDPKVLYDFMIMLRTMSVEADLGDMSKYLAFQYILIHPQVTDFAGAPAPQERYLVMPRPPPTRRR